MVASFVCFLHGDVRTAEQSRIDGLVYRVPSALLDIPEGAPAKRMECPSTSVSRECVGEGTPPDREAKDEMGQIDRSRRREGMCGDFSSTFLAPAA